MTTYEREPQPESWWTERLCPLWVGMDGRMVKKALANDVSPYACAGSICALWRQTKTDEAGEKHGICTKA